MKKEEIEQFLTEINNWQKVTFPTATYLTKLRHLQKEVPELCDTILDSAYIGPGNKMLEYEYADCFLLLFGSALDAGFSLNDILRVMREKLEINKKRQWGKPDENGVIEHIREEDELPGGEAKTISGYHCKKCGARGSFDEFPQSVSKDEDGLKSSDIYCVNENCNGQNEDIEEIYEKESCYECGSTTSELTCGLCGDCLRNLHDL